jgi:argininosuccinate synthase
VDLNDRGDDCRSGDKACSATMAIEMQPRLRIITTHFCFSGDFGTMSESVVLAFSGGLDTSYCLYELKRRGLEVHTVFIDTGGVSADERAYIEQRANQLGAAKHWTVDAGQPLWDEFVVPLIWSGARMLGQYPMLCSDRYVIVRKSLEICDRIGSKKFAHGCTAMGNDQLRFDQTVVSLGDYEILAPVRDLQAQVQKARDREIEILTQAGIEVRVSTSKYSVNENILGVTASGGAIDRFEAPPADIWKWTRPAGEWPKHPLAVTLTFEAGAPVGLNGQSLTGPKMLAQLNRAFAEYGIGRHIYTGDTCVGLKGRIAFECPGLTVLLAAGQALQDAVCTRWQNQFRHTVAQRWAELVYGGFFYEPHKFDLEAYLRSGNRHVSGTVTVETSGGQVLATALDSPHVLRDRDSVYAQSCTWTPQEALGFIKLVGQSSRLSAKINGVPQS